MKQNSFILAAGFLLPWHSHFLAPAMVRKNGIDGTPGSPGTNGAGCIVSSVDEGTKITCG